MPDDRTIPEGGEPLGEGASGGAVPEGATIIEGAGGAAGGATIIEGAVGATIIEGAQARAEARLNLVPGGRFQGYTLQEPLQVTSGEADLWFIADSQGAGYVLKLYRYGIKPKQEITEKIRALGYDHSVQVITDGVASGRSYEVLEKIEHGDLARFATGQPLSGDWLKGMVEELGSAVAHLHQVGILHRDIKPANILVRTLEPLDLVLTDFGISSLSDVSLHMTTVNRTASYCAPEAMQGVVAKASDWWSIGVIVLELLRGRHPFAGMDERAVNFQLVAKGISVPDELGEEWKLLLKGLLTRDPDKRWNWEQVEQWLKGRRDMPVYYQGEQSAQAHGHKPYKISGKECYTAEELAAELGQDWESGRTHLGRGMVTSWVEGQLSDQGLAVDLHDINEDGDLDADEKLSAGLMVMAPELPPFYKGEVVSREWLANHPGRAIEVSNSKLPQLQAKFQPDDTLDLDEIAGRVKQVEQAKFDGKSMAVRELVISMAVDPDYPLKLGDDVIDSQEWMSANPVRAVKILEGPLPGWQAKLTPKTSLNDALHGLQEWRKAVKALGVPVDDHLLDELILQGKEERSRRFATLWGKFESGEYVGAKDPSMQALLDKGKIGPVEQMCILAIDESTYLTPGRKYLQDYDIPMDWDLADELIKANSWEILTPKWTEAVQNPATAQLLDQPEYRRCQQTLHSQSPEYWDVVAMLSALSALKRPQAPGKFNRIIRKQPKILDSGKRKKPDDLTKVNMAFMTMNSLVSVTYFAFTLADLLMRDSVF